MSDRPPCSLCPHPQHFGMQCDACPCRAGAALLYLHDCPTCEYLGTRYIEDVKHDFYYCGGPASSSLHGSVIARFDSEGSGYLSVPVDVLSIVTGEWARIGEAFLTERKGRL